METLIKIVSLCLTAAVLTALLKQNEPTFSLLLAFAAVLLGGVLLVSTVSDAAVLGDELIALTGLSPALFAPL